MTTVWVAPFVATLASGGQSSATLLFPTKAACEAANVRVESLIKGGQVEPLKKHSLTCVKVALQ